MLDYIAVGQGAYASFVGRMQRYALAIIDADKAERDRRFFLPRGKTSNITWIAIPTAPPNRSNFFEGSQLEFMSMPRSLEDSLAPFRVFWQMTRWQHQGPPTTWLELYALYRLWEGGAKADQDLNAPTPSFTQGLQTFIKGSKAFHKMAGNINTRQAVQANQGTELLLDKYVFFCRAPAIRATLCLDPGISDNIHRMLIAIRKAKGESGQEQLKGSCLPLPKFEPWGSVLKTNQDVKHAHGSPTIPSIVQRNASMASDSITLIGQKGDDRDFKPFGFLISCPRCKAVKNASNCTLFNSAACILSCSACRSSSSSTKWHCSHSISWLECPVHREAGFRCKGHSRAQHSKSSIFFKDSRNKARLMA